MRKILAVLLLCLITAVGLSSCDDGSVTPPEGLQVVRDARSEGYVFFGPEGWVVANHGEIAATYFSAVSNTSITFTKIEAPSGTIPEYFDSCRGEFPYEITLTLEDEPTSFGATDNPADEAYKYIYTFKYQEYDFTCMQIILSEDEDYYIFTYTSYGLPTDEESDYREYLEVATLAAGSVLFTDSSPVTEGEAPEYERDGDGYLMVSDKTLSGFELYLPEDYTVIDNSAIVSARISDGAKISLSKTAAANTYILDYLEDRREELSAVVGEVNDIAVNVVGSTEALAFDYLPIGSDSTLSLGNLNKGGIISYEYTYTYCGTVYHVYQVLGVDPGFLGLFGGSGYIFTYTATEAEYSEHIDEVKTIIGKVRF